MDESVRESDLVRNGADVIGGLFEQDSSLLLHEIWGIYRLAKEY